MNSLPADKNRRVLVIDDNRSIHDDFRKILSPVTATATALNATETALFGRAEDAVPPTQFEVDSAYQGQEGVLLVKNALAAGQPYALAFVDVRMPPGWDGVETTRNIWELDPDLQVVLCTAYSDYSWDELFARLGRRDGLLILKKPFDAVEAFQLAHALTEKWWLYQQSRRKTAELEQRVAERTRELQQTNHLLQTEVAEHQRAEKTLRDSDEKFHQLADNITDAFWIRSSDAREVHYISPAFERIWGRSVASLYARPQQWADFILPEDRERALGAFAALTGDTPSIDIVYRIVRPDGEIRWVRVRGYQIRDAADKLIRLTGIVTDITERQQAEESVRLLKSAVEQSSESIVITDAELDLPGPKIVFVNPAFTKMTGYPAAEAIGKNPRILQGPRTDKTVLRRLRQTLKRGEVFNGETINYRNDGTEFAMEWHITPIRNASGHITHFVAIQRDITERKRLEAQLIQSQKMETVGKLAGGIAHEFNSLFTAIIGQSELLLIHLPPGNPLGENATAIRQATERAAILTRQLLAYGRKQMLQPAILDLNALLAGLESTLRDLLGRGMDLCLSPAAGLKGVMADAGQIEQVITNLVMNAAEAMPNGGRLTLATANVALDQAYVSAFPELKAGKYVMLAITDTGTGMSAEAMAHRFEPFFTTKGVGQGTGLGLSTSYGIIKQSGGHISVASELGRGTTFTVYLPQVEPQTKPPMPRLDSPDLPRGTETILLVENDPALRDMAASLLKRLGYRVFAAPNGLEALRLSQSSGSRPVDLLFIDVVLPQINSKELSEQVRALSPRVQILFTSAYAEPAIVKQGGAVQGVAFLPKPFTPSALARKLREVLDQPGDL